MLKLVVCLVVFVVCQAQVPRPCSSPKQWEGRRVRLTMQEDRARQYFEIAMHSYDEINMRTRSIEERVEGKEGDYYDVLHLHNENKEYRFNLRTKQCNVTSTTSPFRYIGVPADAKFYFEAVAGAAGVPGEHLTAVAWGGKFSDGAEYLLEVTVPDCIPLAFDVRSQSGNESFHERYFDVQPGISDPFVFIPPQECMKM